MCYDYNETSEVFVVASVGIEIGQSSNFVSKISLETSEVSNLSNTRKRE